MATSAPYKTVAEIEAERKRDFEIAQQFLNIENDLSAKLQGLNYGGLAVYNPLVYASIPHANYINKYCGAKTVLFLGMNPGPYGMAQNGVPFGDPHYVRDWLQITGDAYPPQELYSNLSEESGSRLWGFIEKVWVTPEQFFRHCFVHNYCPLLFLDGAGKNVPCNKLPDKGFEVWCDKALLQCIQVIGAQIVVGIGNYAFDRAKAALATPGFKHIKVVKIPHPSPKNHQAYAGWEKAVVFDWNTEALQREQQWRKLQNLPPKQKDVYTLKDAMDYLQQMDPTGDYYSRFMQLYNSYKAPAVYM